MKRGLTRAGHLFMPSSEEISEMGQELEAKRKSELETQVVAAKARARSIKASKEALGGKKSTE